MKFAILLLSALLPLTSAWSGIVLSGGFRSDQTQIFSPYMNPTNVINASLGLPDVFGASVVTMNGLMYVIGGAGTSNVLAMDPKTNTTKMLAPLPGQRSIGGAWPITAQNAIVLCGGEGGLNNLQSGCQKYNVSSDTWSVFTSLPTTLAYFASAQVNNDLYIFGGFPDLMTAPHNVADQTYMLASGASKWVAKANMPVGLYDTAAINLAGSDKIMLCGGRTALATIVSDCYIYASGTDTWSKMAKGLQSPRGSHSLVHFSGKYYCIGGDRQLETVEVYDKAAGWQTFPATVRTSSWMSVGVIQM